MRVLKSEEMKNVSGGTFGLLSCLFGGLFGGWGRSSSHCAPVVNTCAPVVNTCAPRRSYRGWC